MLYEVITLAREVLAGRVVTTTMQQQDIVPAHRRKVFQHALEIEQRDLLVVIPVVPYPHTGPGEEFELMAPDRRGCPEDRVGTEAVDELGAGAQCAARARRRITSYNVCYTKLLRNNLQSRRLLP